MANVIANTAKSIMTNRMLGAGTEPKQSGWGTGVGTSAVTDTTLFTETALNLSTTSGTRVAATTSQQTVTNTNDTYRSVATLTAAAAGSPTNYGQFDNATIGSGNLFLKADFTAIALNIGDAVTFTANVQFS